MQDTNTRQDGSSLDSWVTWPFLKIIDQFDATNILPVGCEGALFLINGGQLSGWCGDYVGFEPNG